MSALASPSDCVIQSKIHEDYMRVASPDAADAKQLITAVSSSRWQLDESSMATLRAHITFLDENAIPKSWWSYPGERGPQEMAGQSVG